MLAIPEEKVSDDEIIEWLANGRKEEDTVLRIDFIMRRPARRPSSGTQSYHYKFKQWMLEMDFPARPGSMSLDDLQAHVDDIQACEDSMRAKVQQARDALTIKKLQ